MSRIHRGICGALALLFISSMPTVATAGINIQVDISAQTMHVNADGVIYDWRVSTAKRGHWTPRGHFRPQSLDATHHSKKYHGAPMPHSIFFSGDYAIHGTGHQRQLKLKRVDLPSDVDVLRITSST